MSQIAVHLGTRRPHHLVKCLEVSSSGFDAVAPRLYRYAKLPEYEFSLIQRRPEIDYPHEYTSIGPSDPPEYTYWRPDKKLALPSIKAFDEQGGDWQRYTSPLLQSIGRHVRVVTIEPHLACLALAQICPIPSVRTLILPCSSAHQDREYHWGYKKLCPHAPGGCAFVPKE